MPKVSNCLNFYKHHNNRHLSKLVNEFKIIADKYQNRCKRFCLSFNLISAFIILNSLTSFERCLMLVLYFFSESGKTKESITFTENCESREEISGVEQAVDLRAK
ncbi:putative conjugative transfer protein TraB [Orientia tsutsugamushi str. Gilliam]|nr:putative conjugative transfer protein TraB [Orientia tsutsugamushi str. Gilliam]